MEEKPAVHPPLDLFDAQIWPVEDTPFQFKGSDLKAGTFAAGTPARIVAERDDEFYIRAGDKLGFVSRDACLINLPDVMQRELQYDITNSYSSKYKLDGRRIPGVTCLINSMAGSMATADAMVRPLSADRCVPRPMSPDLTPERMSV